jgi:hypothetical protein
MIMSRAVSIAVQKYGGDSTQPICKDVGTTSIVGSPSSCGRTYAKFHSSPSAQSIRQNPSFISHFAMNIFASGSVSAKACTIRGRHSPIWLIAPAGAVFSVVSLTEVRTPLLARRSQKDKSKIERYAFNLCGMAAIGEIFSWHGGSSFMSSHDTICACPMLTLSAASAAKCAMASGDRADRCGPLATASHISSLVHGCPVLVGQPNVAHYVTRFAAGARPPCHSDTSNFGIAGNLVLLLPMGSWSPCAPSTVVCRSALV